MALTEQEVETAIAKGGYDPTQAQQIRLLMDRKRTRERVAKEIESESAFGFAKRNLAAFGSSAAESGTFGATSALTGALSAKSDPRQNLSGRQAYELAQARRDAELGESGLARTLGTIVGVAPSLVTGPLGLGLRAAGAGRAAAGVASAGNLAARFSPGAAVGNLGFRAAQGNRLALSARAALDAGNRLGSGVRQIGAALAGGVGSQVAYQAGQAGVDAVTEAVGGTARATLSEHVASIINPENVALNLGLAVAGGAASQFAQARVTPEFRADMARLQRHFPNFPVTHSMVRGHNSVLGRIEQAARFTALGRSRMRGFIEDGYIRPLRNWVDGLQRNFGLTPNSRFDRAAAGTRRIVGSLDRPGVIQREADAIGNAAFQGAENRLVPFELIRPIAVGIARFQHEARQIGRPLTGSVSREINRFVGLINDTARTRIRRNPRIGQQGFEFNMNLKALDAGRKELDRIIEWDRYPHLARGLDPAPKAGEIRVARQFRRMIRNAERMMGDDVDNALNQIASLKRTQLELRPFYQRIIKDADAEELMLGALRSTDHRRAYSALTRRFTADERADLTGSFLARVLNRVWDGSTANIAPSKRMQSLFDGALGKEFHFSRWRTLFGDRTANALRQEFEDIAFAGDMFKRHPGLAEGSPTYGRSVDAYAINQMMNMTEDLVEAISTGDPGKWAELKRAMAKGVGWLSLISGVVDGRIARNLKDAAQITAPRFPGSSLPVLAGKEAFIDPLMGAP